MHSRFQLLGSVLVCAAFAACARGERATTDETARDLTLAAPESTAAAGDVSAAAPPATPPAAPAPAVRTATPRPTATEVSRPRAPASYTLAAGTRFHLSIGDTITSRSAKAGDTFTAALVEDVKDAGGRVVVPAGASVRGTIVEVKPAPDPRTPGTLRLALASVNVGGTSYPLEATIDSLETVRQGRGISGGDAARVAGGAAAGAVIGRIIGGNRTGTIIGGVAGAVAGAGVSANIKDSDVVLPAGAHILASLAQPLTVAAR